MHLCPESVATVCCYYSTEECEREQLSGSMTKSAWSLPINTCIEMFVFYWAHWTTFSTFLNNHPHIHWLCNVLSEQKKHFELFYYSAWFFHFHTQSERMDIMWWAFWSSDYQHHPVVVGECWMAAERENPRRWLSRLVAFRILWNMDVVGKLCANCDLLWWNGATRTKIGQSIRPTNPRINSGIFTRGRLH